MCKSIPFSRTIASVLFLFFLTMGCGDADPPKQEPVVVKRRIALQTPPVKPKEITLPVVEIRKPVPAKPEKKNIVVVPEPKKKLSSKALASVEPKTVAEPKADTVTMTAISLTEKIADASPRYDPEGKVNPFVPLFKEKPVQIVSRETKYKRRRPLTPLEKIDLTQLKLVGVIRAQSGNRAMVEDATGKGYVVIKGTYVGIHGGRVVEIAKDRAFIEEEIEDIFGKLTVSRKELKLQKPAGEE